MYALIQWRESFRALRKSRKWDQSRANIWARITGSSLTQVHTSLPQLDSTRAEIRLMHLAPGTGNDPITCSLEVVSLNDEPNYEALSYCWSRTEDAEMLTSGLFSLNDSEIQILPNLSNALHRLRQAESPRKLWIDYICINQFDTQERNDQVQLMGNIYKNARQVICWLGEEDAETADAIQFLRDIQSAGTHWSEIVERDTKEVIVAKIIALKNLLRRPWFQRIWTVQEIALSREAVLVCGSHTISWQTVLDASHFSNEHWYCCIYFVQTYGDLGDLSNTLIQVSWRWIPKDLQPSICDLLSRFIEYHASDARDYIYGLLGLLSDSELKIKPDYDLPASAVFRRVAVEIMRHEGSIQYLTTLFSTSPPPNNIRGLPSWVVDFSSLSWNSVTKVHNGLFNACGSHDRVHFRVISEDTISYRGAFIDQVKALDESADMEFGVKTVADAKALLAKLENLERLAQEYQTSLVYDNSLPYIDKDQLTSLDNKPLNEEGTTNIVSNTNPMTRATGTQQAHDAEIATPLSSLFKALYRTLTFGYVGQPGGHPRRVGTDDEATYLIARRALAGYAASPPHTPESEFYAMLAEDDVFTWALEFTSVVCGTRFFITERGYMGVGPKSTQAGDKVAIFQGGRIPLILRAHGDHLGWTARRYLHSYLGFAYIDGVMDGEAVEGAAEGGWRKILTTVSSSNRDHDKQWEEIALT